MPIPAERLTARFHVHAGFLASNLDHECTGVEGAVIWIFAGEPNRNESASGPRILVALGETLAIKSLTEAVVVRLSSPPEVLGTLPPSLALKAVDFARANRTVLRRYWEGEMDTRTVIELLVRV